jgi:hypothetical protein
MYGLFGDWVAGFGNGFTGGISTDIYSSITGTPLQPKDGFLWTMGNIAGIGASLLVGMKFTVNYQASIGQANFWATYQVVTSGYGVGKGLVGLADGYWEFNDVFNLLGLLPVAGTLLGSSKGIAGMRASNSGGKSNLADGNAEDAFNGLGQTDVSVSGACFVAGTEVLTPDGEKSIEAIRVGDWVVADDPNTIGEIEYKQVTDTFVRQTDKLVDLYIDGEVISTTEEHPFWTPDKGWVEAKDLTVGSLLQTEDGRVVNVDGVETREGSFEVYNFKVEGFHSYFVSDLGVLVHNADYDLQFQADDLVYGPSANLQLRELQQTAGGKLLTDLPDKPPELTWLQHSIQTMEQQTAMGKNIRFDLTHMQDLQNILQNKGPYANTVTAGELRHIQSNWSRFQRNVFFYKNGKEVSAPWM